MALLFQGNTVGVDAGHVIEGLLSLCLGLLYVLKHQEVRKLRASNQLHQTFADDPERFWIRMKDAVTEPISAVLTDMKDVMREQARNNQAVLEALARMEGENRARRRI